LLNLIADNTAMYNIFLTYRFPIFFIKPLFFTHAALSCIPGLIPIKLAASFTLLNLSKFHSRGKVLLLILQLICLIFFQSILFIHYYSSL
jgi:hypothetical protein